MFLTCEGEQGPASTFSWLKDPASLDALYHDLETAGAGIEQGPTHQPWGLYEMNVVDPYGNTFRFATSSPQVDVDVEDARS